jgi:hypothetical protein
MSERIGAWYRAAATALLSTLLILPGSSSKATELQPGDALLPTGAIVRDHGAPVSASAYKDEIQKRFLRLIEKKVSPNISNSDNWIINLEVKNPGIANAFSVICDEYVGYVVQPQVRLLLPSIKKLTININGAEPATPETCNYEIKERLRIYASDGAALPRQPFEFRHLSLDKLQSVTLAALAQSRRVDVALPIIDYFVIVPVPLVNRAELGRYLTAAAEKLYLLDKTKVLRFIAVEGAAESDHYRLPGYSVMAFRDASGKIILIEDIRLKILRKSGEGADKAHEYVELSILNLKLSEIVASDANAMRPGGAGFEYMKQGLYDDAIVYLNTAGQFAAGQFEVPSVVVLSRAPIPGASAGLQTPINFERRGDNWEITNRPQ